MDIRVTANVCPYLKTFIWVLLLLTCIWKLWGDSKQVHSEQNENRTFEWTFSWYKNLFWGISKY